MKLLYIKNGDVAAQVRRIKSSGPSLPEGGPDAFLADLLSKSTARKLLISWDIVNDKESYGDADAITYQIGGPYIFTKKIALRILASLRSVRQIIRFRPDRVICGRVGLLLWLTCLLSKPLNYTYIHSRHNNLVSTTNRFYHKVALFFDKLCIHRAAGVICHGPFLAKQVVDIGIDKNRVYDFDVGYKRFTEQARKNPYIHPTKLERVILYVGRMARNKGIFDLLDAGRRLRDRGEEIKIQYIGEGPDLEYLKKIVKCEGMEENIEIKGRVDHDKLIKFFNAAFLVVTPTRSDFPEGRCMSAMEGLACGVPVLAPNYGPFPYLVKHEINGLLYQVDSVDELCQQILRVVEDIGFYNKLCIGAIETSRRLEKPDMTFFEAAQCAFGDIHSDQERSDVRT